MRIALIIPEDYAALMASGVEALDEATLLGCAFAALGAELEPVWWRARGVDFGRFDGVLVKCAWDYIHHAGAFLEWLRGLEARGVHAVNDATLVTWNHDKRYLRELADSGVRVAPFELFPRGRASHLLDAIDAKNNEEGWDQVVLKPSISGGAFKTFRFERHERAAIETAAAEILEHADLLVQPFFEEIVSAGEWSLLFIEGELSHVVCKMPKAGDYRSQPTFGATARASKPPPGLVEQAARVLRAAPRLPVYARVDGFLRDGDFHLMELEIIEPYFFFEHAPEESVARFCQAVLRPLQSSGAP